MKEQNQHARSKFIIKLILITLLIFITIISGGNFSNFIDPFSILFILILSTLILSLSKQSNDYIRAIKIATGNTDFTKKEYMASENAINLSIKSIYMSGILGSLIGFIQIATFSSSLEMTIASSRVAILTFFYAIVINIIQYAIKSSISNQLIYRNTDLNKNLIESENEIGLSKREVEVFELAMTGITNKEISENLFIAESTVKKHMQNILKKTICEDRAAMIDKYSNL